MIAGLVVHLSRLEAMASRGQGKKFRGPPIVYVAIGRLTKKRWRCDFGKLLPSSHLALESSAQSGIYHTSQYSTIKRRTEPEHCSKFIR